MKITAMKTYLTHEGGRPRALVKVETDEGIYGWGEAYCHGPERAIEPIVDYIFEMIKGEDPRRIEFLMLKQFQQFRFPQGERRARGNLRCRSRLLGHQRQGGEPPGLHAARRRGARPRLDILPYPWTRRQRSRRSSKAAERRVGFYRLQNQPLQTADRIGKMGLMCKAGAQFFEQLRNECPDEWEFAFDPPAKIFEPIRALQLANALAPYDPYFYEEPLRPERRPAWGRLRAQMQVPLATGESLYTRFEFLDLLAQQGADIIQPDICSVGGLLEMRKIAAIAEAHYVTVAPHNPMGPLATAVNVHFAAATPNFKYWNTAACQAETIG